MHKQISNDLIEVANKFPDLTVSISIKDLMAANRSLINETKEELTRTITESKQEMYLPRERKCNENNVKKIMKRKVKRKTADRRSMT